MFLPEDGTARQQVRLDISLYAKTSGIVNYVISESSSAQNALIVSSLL